MGFESYDSIFEYEEKILYVGVCLNILYVIKRSGC